MIPLQCEYFALEGLAQLVRTLDTVRARANAALEIEGIVFTLFDARTTLTAQVRAEVERYFKGQVFQTSHSPQRAAFRSAEPRAVDPPVRPPVPGRRSPIWSWRGRWWHVMKRALGRGLGALLPPAEADDGGRLRDLAIDTLVPNPQQPRRDFDERALEELAQSIRSSGILQPLVVRPRGAQYEILVGERRWRAAQRAGLARVPAIVREASDAEALELALVENLLREDLNPSRRRRRTSGCWRSSGGPRRSWRGASARTAPRSPMRSASSGCRRRSWRTSAPGG